MAYWLAIGPPDNWDFCFKNNSMWGFSLHYQNAWELLTEGDVVLCYATRPVKGLIGYCTVKSKRKEDRLFFPQEREQKQVLWPLRLTLKIDKMIPSERWATHCIYLERRGVTLQRALQRLNDKRAQEIIRELDKVR